MMFLDTLKLTFNNVNLLWKVLLYHLICIVLVSGVTVAICYPLITNLSSAGFFADIVGLVEQNMFNLRLDQTLVTVADIINKFIDIVVSDLPLYLPYTIAGIAMLAIFGEFLGGLAEIPTKECLYGYMGSWSRLGFMGCYIKNLGRSVKYSLTKLLVVLPFDLILIAGIIALMYLYKLGFVWSVFAPFLIILALTLFIAIRQVLFGGWVSAIIVKNKRVFEGLRAGLHSYSKAFGRVFSLAISVVLMVIALNIMAITLTASVGLIIAVPLSLIFIYTFNMVAYFYTNGLRFYIDKNKIVSPRKIEDFESMYALKDII